MGWISTHAVVVDISGSENYQSRKMGHLDSTNLVAEATSFKSQGAILWPMKPTLPSTLLKEDGLAQSEDSGIRSGFAELDHLTGGFQPGQLIFVAGRYSMGKTALALNIAEYVAISEHLPVAVFCLASSCADLQMRLVSSVSGISLRTLQAKRMSNEDWRAFLQANEALQRCSLQIEGHVRLSMKELSDRTRRLADQHGKLGLIFVDDLQRTHVSANRGPALASELEALSHALKLLAQEHGCPILVPTQLGRRMELRRDKRPRLTDLRASGRLEKEADKIITVYRDDYYNAAASLTPGVAEIHVVKQRNGNVGWVTLTFNKALTKFENLTATHQDSI